MLGTIVSGNTASDGGREVWFKEGNGYYCQSSVLTANAFNLFGRNGNAGVVGFSPGAKDIVASVGLSKILGPLVDNGGPTLTHALMSGSPAIDRVPDSNCSADPVNGVDQRGQPRNVDGNGNVTSKECDIGAYELQPAMSPTPTATATGSPSPTATQTPVPTTTTTPQPSPTPGATATGQPTPTATVEVSPTATGQPTVTASPTATVTPLPYGVYLPVTLN
ncbi:MAG: choice-of-anchor Q domain-containing protein [Chloroflexota bacterium]